MGRAKQLLDVAGRPMVLATLQPLAAAQIAGVVLVTHRAITTQLGVDDLPGVVVAYNEDDTSEMIDSIRLGLHAWLEREIVADHDGFLICPGDHPGITTADFDHCIAAFRRTPDRIVIASRAGRRGQPTVFPASFVPFAQSIACDTGLNALPRSHSERVLTVECPSPGVGQDVDTPRDYDRLA